MFKGSVATKSHLECEVEIGIDKLLILSVHKKQFYCFFHFVSLNLIALVIISIYDCDLPCISFLNDLIIIFVCTLIGISFRKGFCILQ